MGIAKIRSFTFLVFKSLLKSICPIQPSTQQQIYLQVYLYAVLT